MTAYDDVYRPRLIVSPLISTEFVMSYAIALDRPNEFVSVLDAVIDEDRLTPDKLHNVQKLPWGGLPSCVRIGID